MKIINVPFTKAQKVMEIPMNLGEASVYFRVLGGANIRIGTNPEQLEQSTFPTPGAPGDGLDQAQGDGEKWRLWRGTIYAIADGVSPVPGALSGTFLKVVCPRYDQYSAVLATVEGVSSI